MKLKNIIITVIIMFSLKVGYSQSVLTNSVVVLPSPSVASFQQLDFSQVDLYNGLPSVNIPIYEIKSKDFKFPITLSYRFSGLKVEEVSGWLGLGWKINAGGMISHIVRGKPDEDFAYGYNYVRNELEIPDPIKNSVAYNNWASTIRNDKDILRKFADGIYDGLPDSYVLTANTLSGDLINYGNDNYVSNPYKKYKIKKSGENWEIIDELGNKYIFGSMEGDTNSNYGLERTSYEHYVDTRGRIEEENYVSSWFLREIITNTNEVIKFNYTSEIIARLPSLSESRFKQMGIGDCPKMIHSSSSITFNPVTTWKISSIECRSCIIYFHSSTIRHDKIEGSNSCSLDSILIKDFENNLVKKFIFDYDYLGNTNDNERCRLVLKGITECGNDFTCSPPYMFEYNESRTVPSYESKSSDFWGFYNGKSNTTLIPSNIPGSTFNNYFTGNADRYPDSSYSKLGLLEKITLPTKGEISYSYEPNQYGYIKGQANPAVPVIAETTTVTASVSSESAILSDSKRIVVPDNQSVLVEYSIQDNNYPLLENGEVSITSFVGQPPIYNVKQNNSSGNEELILPSGIYFLNATVYTEGHSASISLTYSDFEKDANGDIIYSKNQPAAGNRLQKIVQFNGISHQNDKIITYKYLMDNEPDRSSGAIHNPINYDFITTGATVSLLADFINYPANGQFCSFAGRSNSNRASLFGSDGYIGYQHVVVEEEGNGSMQYYYTTFPDLSFPGLSQSISKAYKRGNLKKMVTKDQLGNVKYIKENYYKSDLENRTGTAGVFLVEYEQNNVQDYLDIFKEPYLGIIQSEWYYLSESIETHFEANGSIVDSTFFSYTNPIHAQLTTVRKRQSDGKESLVDYYYPLDKPTGTEMSSSILDSMDSMNMQFKIKTEKRVDNTIVDGQIVNYGENLLPSSLYTYGSNSYRLKSNFSQYDEYGNLLEVIDRDGIPTSYLWSYNSVYPVARITNIDQQSIPPSIKVALKNHLFTNSTSFNSIRSDVSYLKGLLGNYISDNGYQLSLYTYKPLLGMTSQTDPNGKTTYYEYDDFGRLKIIKDNNENILRSNSYHYKNQN